MIVLLNGHSLDARTKFQAERMSVSLSERGSTATLTVPEGTPALAVDDWLQDEHGPAAGIVWRVRSIETQYERGTRTVQLEHVINTLRDRIMFGEIKPETISGGSGNPTAKQAAEYILGRQSDWVLGDFSYSLSNPYSFNSDDLFSAMETVSGTLQDCIWEYDFSAYPFTLHIRQMSAEVTSEMRMSRNITALRIQIDRTRMYTRHYPIGKNNLHLSGGGYTSKNESIWGTVARVETDASLDTEAKLRAWSLEQVSRHCEPLVTVMVTGLELSADTGEPLDHIVVGRRCRLPLPEFGTTITERVMKLSYPDTVSDPMNVTVTLANELQDVASILRQEAARSGRAGRASAKNAEEDHAWFVDTTDHVSMIAEAVAGTDGSGNPNWSRISELTVDGQGIDLRVTATESDVVTAMAELSLTDGKIESAVSSATSRLYSVIEQTASYIRSQIVDAENGLYNYTNSTASMFHRTLINTTNRIWVQEYDPTTEAGGSHDVKTGDMWVESTHQGSWDGAEGFDWEHNENFDWFAIQGAKIWSWANDKWELVSDQQQVVSWSDVVDTAEQTVNRKLAAIVNDEGLIDVYMSKLEQTADAIRADVSVNASSIYAYIHMTATALDIGAGARPTVVRQTDPPTSINNRGLKENDVWVKTNHQESWDAAIDFNWQDDNDVDWNELRNDQIFVYDGERWVPAFDDTILAEDTDIQTTSSQIALMARNIATVDGYAKENVASLRVRANKIESEVKNVTDGLGSRITQTATQIQSSVYAAQSQLYSQITQTASQIRLEVNNNISGVRSQLTQTAEQIRAEVSAANSELYSTIQQTATGVFVGVYNDVSENFATLEITDSKIEAKVSAASSALTSVIQQTATQVFTGVYSLSELTFSTISQTATSIDLAVNNAKSEMRSSINMQADRIDLVVSGTGSNAKVNAARIVTAVNNADASIMLSANHIILDGYVKATDITSDYVATKLAAATNVNAKKLTVTDNGWISLPTNDGPINITGATAAGIIRGLKVVSSGNSYHLQAITYGDANWHDLPNSTFSRAVGSWSVGASNGNINVTANPQNQTKSVKLSIGGPNSITSNGTRTYKVYYENSDGDDVETGASMNVSVNVSQPVSSWVVSASNGNLNVKAQPQNQTKSVKLNIGGPNSITSNGTKTYKIYYENDAGDDIETGAKMDVAVNVYPNSMSITRAGWHSTSGNVYYGKLYYWDDDDQSYQPVSSSSHYWYYSSTNKSGTTSVHY